jgi:hypoxanthine phosphoribosyltransferase
MDTKTFGMIIFTWSKKPDLDNLFDPLVSKKLDSISIRFQNYIVSSLIEKVLNWRVIR